MSKKAFEKIKAGLDEALIVAPYLAEIERLKQEVESWKRLHAVQQEASLRMAREALERISDTDPDDGTAWFHEQSNAALAAIDAVLKQGDTNDPR